jgi:hypothetical protein
MKSLHVLFAPACAFLTGCLGSSGNAITLGSPSLGSADSLQRGTGFVNALPEMVEPNDPLFIQLLRDAAHVNLQCFERRETRRRRDRSRLGGRDGLMTWESARPDHRRFWRIPHGSSPQARTELCHSWQSNRTLHDVAGLLGFDSGRMPTEQSGHSHF